MIAKKTPAKTAAVARDAAPVAAKKVTKTTAVKVSAKSPTVATVSTVARVSRADRVIARKRQLIELTMQLVQEKGFALLSVNELAERASMSVGGLYRYIKTKNDLLEMVCDGINQGINQHMLEAATAVRGVPQKLQVGFQVYWEACWDAAEPVLMAYREWQSLPPEAQRRYISQEMQVSEYFGDLIRAGVASGEFRAVNSKLLASEMVFLAQMRAVKGWAVQDWDRADVFAEHWELIIGRLRGGPEQPAWRPGAACGAVILNHASDGIKPG